MKKQNAQIQMNCFWRLQPVYINSQKQLKLNLQKQPYQMAVLLGHTALPNANVMWLFKVWKMFADLNILLSNTLNIYEPFQMQYVVAPSFSDVDSNVEWDMGHCTCIDHAWKYVVY